MGAVAQTYNDLKAIVEGAAPETSLQLSKTNPSLCQLALSSEAQQRDNMRRRARLTYPALPTDNVASPTAEALSLNDTGTSATQGIYYKPLDDMSWAGIPLFVAGIIAKSQKEAFRQDYNNPHVNTRLLTNFKTGIDDYTQFISPVTTVGLKLGGIEGRSDWQRLMVSAAMSYGIMAGLVNGIKYTASEMRPDGSTANSWPSGHTATAFVGATILHKEYGLTRSPWFSVLGYGTATATGIMRVLNNRHWVSDVLSGAGIGIFSGELAYMLSDLIYKDRHLLRGPLTSYPDFSRKHPSFFDVSMGIGLGGKDLDFSGGNEEIGKSKDIKLNFRSAMVVQAEGAYFFNNFIGVGGRLRVRTSPINGWSNFMETAQKESQEQIEEVLTDEKDAFYEGTLTDMITTREFSIESDHLTEFAGDVGVYFNIPINERFALGSKLLIGRSIMQSLDVDARYTGKVKSMDFDAYIRDNQIVDIGNVEFHDTGKTYDVDFDYVTVSGDNSTKWGTGISLSYAYKDNFCWKVFCDYDYTRKTYTLAYNPNEFMYEACSGMMALATLLDVNNGEIEYSVQKDMHQFVIGASLSIQF